MRKSQQLAEKIAHMFMSGDLEYDVALSSVASMIENHVLTEINIFVNNKNLENINNMNNRPNLPKLQDINLQISGKDVKIEKTQAWPRR